ncbi:hypothetical protein CTAYLR_003872 [Chrysophaeum taylorii]|uniref:Phytanoyl-CoA dioxygenase n=1 Tax=Chrysophaeum taylorii TaxID=2483200 RepID=A0AAD7XLW0_9STRA|nr:hypothetical protein CTAYLR_003872 [Chrysophaeum taylorii]
MDAFSSSSSDDEEDELAEVAKAIVEHVVRGGAQIARISACEEACEPLRRRVAAAGLHLIPDEEAPDVVLQTRGVPRVRRGGIVASLEPPVLDFGGVPVLRTRSWIVARRRVVTADAFGCAPWGPADADEHDRVETCCGGRAAARTLRERGLVILPGLVSDAEALASLADDALENFEACRLALLNSGVDLLRPGLGREPRSYRELAMREDLRCDVRACLAAADEDAFRQAARVAAAVAREATTIQASPLRRGNYGRWNFDDSGPLAPPRPLRVGAFAAVVSLPGAAEQALHADTPHLFDHVQLPGHYFNLFLAVGDTPVDPLAGQTAFILDSHRLDVCADLTADDSGLRRHLVRPRLRSGDAVLFDARILHFGLPNRSQLRRPMIYANIHEAWFVDPKNWDDSLSVFDAAATT